MHFDHHSSLPGNAFRVNARVRPVGHWQHLFLACLLLSVAISSAEGIQADPVHTSATDELTTGNSYEETWLEVQVLGQPSRYTVLALRQKDGRVLLRGEDLEIWRLRLPGSSPVSHLGEDYFLLDEIPGLTYREDTASQALMLEADANLFESTTIAFVSPTLEPTPASRLGGYFNYDVNAVHTQGQTHTNGFFELGLFGGRGVATNTFLANDRDYSENVIRLDSTWTRDLPALRASFRVGDTISQPGAWGRSVRFGGVQWATNFSTQPGFITFPLPAMSGEAVLPSSMDLYVNGMLRMRDDVPSGPFSIDNLPIVTGGGEMQLVLRDMLGREQVITQPFYASTALLKTGLHDYSYELGSIRENYGVRSNDYGRFLAVATHRLGLSDQLTAEARLEVLSGQQTLGLGGAFLWDDMGVFRFSVAASNSDMGRGGLLRVGFDHQSPGFGFGVDTQITNAKFTQLGLYPNQPAPKQISRAFVSVPIRQYGSININYSYQDYRIRKKMQTISASYGVSIGRSYLAVSAVRFFGEDPYTRFSLSLSRPLGRRTTASANVNYNRGHKQLLLQVQRGLPVGSGFGYRLRAGLLDADSLEAGVSAQTDFGTYYFDAGRYHGQTSYRANISGGLAILGGNFHLSRRITDSFAIIKVDDFENVRVLAENQLVGTTGANGSVLVPGLRAYESNTIRIEMEDLPMDAQIDGSALEVAPYYRSGLLLNFPVKRVKSGLLTIVLDNGEPLPSGIMVTHLAYQQTFPVGFKGLVYVTNLQMHNTLQIKVHGQSCEFDVEYPQTTDPLPDLGTYVCSGVNP